MEPAETEKKEVNLSKTFFKKKIGNGNCLKKKLLEIYASRLEQLISTFEGWDRTQCTY